MPFAPHRDLLRYHPLIHVIVRQVERLRIVRGDADRRLFLHRLADWVSGARARLSAWARMPRHASAGGAPAGRASLAAVSTERSRAQMGGGVATVPPLVPHVPSCHHNAMLVRRGALFAVAW